MMRFRPFTPADYPQYSQWLESRDRPLPEFDDLPEWGRMAYDDDGEYCVGFIFAQGPRIAILCNFASNPYGDQEKRGSAVEALIDHLIQIAKNKGFEMVFVNTNRQKLIERLLNKNFMIYDEKITQLGRKICQPPSQ